MANHSKRICGIAPGVTGIILPIFETVDGQLVPAEQALLGERIVEAIKLGAHIINISAGEFTSNTTQPLANALKLAESSGVLVIAAAGNQACQCINVPAAWSSVLAVGSHNRTGTPSTFSNFGGHYNSNGLLAPGEDLLCLSPSGEVISRSGTSYASAFVTGLAGLIQSVFLSRSGALLSGMELKDMFLKTSDPCDPAVENSCERFLYGRLNIDNIIKEVLTMTDTSGPSNLQGHELNNEIPNLDISPPKIQDVVLPTPVGTNPQEIFPQATGIDAKNQEINGNGVMPAACSCDGEAPPTPQLAYTIGAIQHSFASQSSRDAVQQYMSFMVPPGSPDNPIDVIRFIHGDTPKKSSKEPHGIWEGGIEYAHMFIWMLVQDETPVYALVPILGRNPDRFFEKVVDIFNGQFDEKQKVERCSVPGIVQGIMNINDGQLKLPVLHAETIGIFQWKTSELVDAIAPDNEEKKNNIRSFLDRVYYELANTGISPSDRALNYSGTNAFHIERIFETVNKTNLELDQIQVEKSRLCRPHADCWDVKLVFFNPQRRTEESRKVYRFTVDVSGVLPVTVGPVRSWSMF